SNRPLPFGKLLSGNASPPFCILGVEQDAINPYRLRDVLDPLLPHWFKAECELLLHFLGDLVRNTNATRIGKLLQPRGNVDAFPVAVFALDDHLAQINADPDIDTLVPLNLGIALGHAPLKGDSAFDCVDDTTELSEEAISHELENAPTVLSNLRFEKVLS